MQINTRFERRQSVRLGDQEHVIRAITIFVLEDGNVVENYYLDGIYVCAYGVDELTPFAPDGGLGEAREWIAASPSHHTWLTVDKATGQCCTRQFDDMPLTERQHYLLYPLQGMDAERAVASWLKRATPDAAQGEGLPPMIQLKTEQELEAWVAADAARKAGE